MQQPTQVPFQQVMESLLKEQEPFVHFYRLTNLEGEDRKSLAQNWLEIPVAYRRKLVENLENAAADDTLLCYEPIARIGLTDPDPEVRLTSIRMLWGEDSPGLEDILLKMQDNDLDERVRAGAASGLGYFVYEGELEELPAKTLKVIEEKLLEATRGKDSPLVRRKALESLGYSSRPEVTGLIEVAFASDDDDWVASALLAMGRSADKRWTGDVLRMLDNENPFIRLEAVRAAGELEVKRATPSLIEMLNDPDDDVRAAVIWSLSQIGGQGVSDALEDWLEDNDDEEEVALIEEALENLAFNEGIGSFDLFDFDEDDLSEMVELDTDDEDDEDFDDLDDEDE
ncbi:MAG TPA: HEAT repeat domain-containing protein [Anaerolineales bacterium]|nr:HEAT repeat domain-containing protein [Anaerolineales bacterium]